MTFTLTFIKGWDSGTNKLESPTPEMIEQAIDDLLPVRGYFVILESKQLVNSIEYIQTVIKDDDESTIEYLVEVHERTDESFIQHRKFFADVNEVKKMFRMFALELPPDVAGWEDVTAETKGLPPPEVQRKNSNG